MSAVTRDPFLSWWRLRQAADYGAWSPMCADDLSSFEPIHVMPCEREVSPSINRPPRCTSGAGRREDAALRVEQRREVVAFIKETRERRDRAIAAARRLAAAAREQSARWRDRYHQAVEQRRIIEAQLDAEISRPRVSAWDLTEARREREYRLQRERELNQIIDHLQEELDASRRFRKEAFEQAIIQLLAGPKGPTEDDGV